MDVVNEDRNGIQTKDLRGRLLPIDVRQLFFQVYGCPVPPKWASEEFCDLSRQVHDALFVFFDTADSSM